MNIIKPNNHKIDKKKIKLWLDNSDSNIKTIANEFILKTTHISYNIFKKFLLKSLNEMLSNLKTTTLQFFIISDNDEISYKFKSGYWIFKHLLNYINTEIYTIKMIHNIKDIDLSIPIIIPDDASYSGSQISSFIENFENTICDIYILIPFISNTAIDVIKNAFNEYNINGELYFSNKKFIMKPIYDLMEEHKIEKLFSYYTINGKNIREYPIYFDHKVADNYSSFPLIYTYGIIPNTHNKNIIQMCKKNRIPLKKHFNELEKMPILKNCDFNIEYNLSTPSCPLQPYKHNFLQIKSKSINFKSNKSLSNKSKSKSNPINKGKIIKSL